MKKNILVRNLLETKRPILLFLILTILATGLAIVFFDRPVILFFDSAEFKQNYWQFFRTWTDAGLGEIYFLLAIGGFVLSKSLLWICLNRESQKYPDTQLKVTSLPKIDFYRRGSVNLFCSLLFSGLVLQITKHLVGRQRPLETLNFDSFVFQPFNLNSYYHSMPSGHAQVIFSAATVFAFGFPKLKWLWFSFAVFIALTRIATQQHWLSDTFVGAYVGWSVSTLTVLWLCRFPRLNLYTN